MKLPRTEPLAGQEWLDRDPRMKGRAVIITKVTPEAQHLWNKTVIGRVYYRAKHGGQREYKSYLDRFVKAFELSSQSDAASPQKDGTA